MWSIVDSVRTGSLASPSHLCLSKNLSFPVLPLSVRALQQEFKDEALHEAKHLTGRNGSACNHRKDDVTNELPPVHVR